MRITALQPESFLSLSLYLLLPRFILLFLLILFHHTVVNAWKSVVRLYMLLTSYMSLKFNLHQSLLLNCQRMPMVDREVTGFPIRD